MIRTALQSEFERLKSAGLKLNLTRGKPAPEQVALSNALDGILDGNFIATDGIDVRNYGGSRGLPEARELGSYLLDTPVENVIAGGNSSLHLMFLSVDVALHTGLARESMRSTNTPAIAICPVPGYDRHFAVTEALGVPMTTVSLNEDGPDMADLEQQVKASEGGVFVWCVPKHSNPTGCTYSAAVVERIANLPNLNPDCYVLWDNAYSVHDFHPSSPKLASVFAAADRQGTLDRIVQFASTSKITFAGAGVSFVGGSSRVLESLDDRLSRMTIGPDKVNQLRHARFLRDGEGIRAHMERHAEILRPKFAAVADGLTRELGNTGLAQWTDPTGGYFVSVDLQPGMAKRAVALAADSGLALTPAGATFPYAIDPRDSNVRIAPTYATTDEIEQAMHIVGICVKLAAEQG